MYLYMYEYMPCGLLLTMDAPSLLVLSSSSSADNFSNTSSNVYDTNTIYPNIFSAIIQIFSMIK